MNPSHQAHHDDRRARVYIGRALRLRCPECGISPIFVPARKVRSLWDWFTPLDGCPRCGYAYQREDGYFLLAIWGLNYGLIASLALAAAFLLDHAFDLTITQLILIVAIPMPICSILFARHAKSLYIALDHYFDPHCKDDSPQSHEGTKADL